MFGKLATVQELTVHVADLERRSAGLVGVPRGLSLAVVPLRGLCRVAGRSLVSGVAGRSLVSGVATERCGFNSIFSSARSTGQNFCERSQHYRQAEPAEASRCGCSRATAVRTSCAGVV